MNQLFRQCLIVLLSCIIILSVHSCSQQQIKNQIASFCESVIQFPYDLEVWHDNCMHSDSLYRIPTNSIKFVFYFSEDECSSCAIEGLGIYEEFFRLTVDDIFYPMIIFSPKDGQEYKALQVNLKLTPFPYPIYIDKRHIFQQLNVKIPKDTRYHSFLLDKNNRVVLVGNPLASDAMWTLFRSTLDNMLAHDGVYVPEK